VKIPEEQARVIAALTEGLDEEARAEIMRKVRSFQKTHGLLPEDLPQALSTRRGPKVRHVDGLVLPEIAALRQRRFQLRMTQADVGAKIGVAGSMISMYETGRIVPNHRTVRVWGNALGLTPGWVEGVDDVPVGESLDCGCPAITGHLADCPMTDAVA
jgi:DNA-binding XRE family transcriptional regulator